MSKFYTKLFGPPLVGLLFASCFDEAKATEANHSPVLNQNKTVEQVKSILDDAFNYPETASNPLHLPVYHIGNEEKAVKKDEKIVKTKPKPIIAKPKPVAEKPSDSQDKSHTAKTKPKPIIAKPKTQHKTETSDIRPSQPLNMRDPETEKAGLTTLSSEEARTGYQRSLTVQEIHYFKNLCRYAFMSDKEVIEYNCQAKNILRRR